MERSPQVYGPRSLFAVHLHCFLDDFFEQRLAAPIFASPVELQPAFPDRVPQCRAADALKGLLHLTEVVHDKTKAPDVRLGLVRTVKGLGWGPQLRSTSDLVSVTKRRQAMPRREPKIGPLGHPVLVDQHVHALDVVVQHAARVHVVEPRRELPRPDQAVDALYRECVVVGNHVVETAHLAELHDDGHCGNQRSSVHADHILVSQAHRQTQLAPKLLELAQCLFVAPEPHRGFLDRDQHPFVERFLNHPKTPTSNLSLHHECTGGNHPGCIAQRLALQLLLDSHNIFLLDLHRTHAFAVRAQRIKPLNYVGTESSVLGLATLQLGQHVGLKDVIEPKHLVQKALHAGSVGVAPPEPLVEPVLVLKAQNKVLGLLENVEDLLHNLATRARVYLVECNFEVNEAVAKLLDEPVCGLDLLHHTQYFMVCDQQARYRVHCEPNSR